MVVRAAHGHQHDVHRTDGRDLLVGQRVAEVAKMRNAHASGFEDEHRVESGLRAALAVVVHADRAHGDVLDPLVDLHPALLVGGQPAQDAWLALQEGEVGVVGVLVADGHGVGVQVSGRQVTDVGRNGIHEDARAAGAFEQKAGLAIPSQVRHRPRRRLDGPKARGREQRDHEKGTCDEASPGWGHGKI